MKNALVFAAGFAAGWASRSMATSSHGAAVNILAFLVEATERVRRRTAIERERFEDLVAEARAQASARRAARTAKTKPVEQPMDRAA